MQNDRGYTTKMFGILRRVRLGVLRPSAPEKESNSPVCTAGYRNEEGCPAEGGGGV